MNTSSKVGIIISFFILCLSANVHSQDDPTLFSVNGEDVKLSEFQYIYNKNNSGQADYSEKSLQEYLDLYTNFKLKVAKAKEMGLDTVPRLQKELAGYRKKLADSYLSDKEVSEKLFAEVFERMQTDVNVSHILIKAKEKSAEELKAIALRKINSIKEQIDKGATFESMAESLSEDKSSASNGGKIGYFTAMLPSGFYEFENAMYNTPVGKVSDVIKTNLGYHLIKVNATRPARGEMEVAHLLIRKKIKGEVISNAKSIADSLYNVLAKGGHWDSLVEKHSQDKNTARKKGYLGFFGINQYDQAFEQAAFELKSDNDISKAIETKIGYHIIKRISKRDLSNEDENRKRLQAKIEKAPRSEAGKKALIEQIKKDSDLKEDKVALNEMIGKWDKDFYSYKWKVPESTAKDLLNYNNNYVVSTLDFAEYCRLNSRTRLRFDKKLSPQESAMKMYDAFVDEKTLAYEEANLEEKYPDFKSLMREYSEGILLFEVTKMEVWDKASQDSVGLKKFYDQRKSNFTWNERARLERYVVKTTDEKLAKKVRKEAKKKSSGEVLEKFNTNEKTIVSYQSDLFEKESRQLEGIQWGKGEQTDLVFDDRKGEYSFSLIRNILPKSQKTLSEAKGYVIADYQDALEKKWIASLKKKYPINLDQKVFKSMIK